MRKRLRILIRVTAAILLLLVFAWFALLAYMQTHQQKVLHLIVTNINENIQGKLTIGSMKYDMWHNFPGVSFTLNDIYLTDSQYKQQPYPLLEAKYLHLSFNVFSVLQSKPRVNDIELAQGRIFLYTDSNGYSNLSLIKSNADSSSKSTSLQIAALRLREVEFIIKNMQKQKDFDIVFHNLKAGFSYPKTGWQAKVRTDAFIRSFTFNTDKGSFLRKKSIRSRFNASYNKAGHIIDIPKQRFVIGKDAIAVMAKFDLAVKPVGFYIRLVAPHIPFERARDLLSPNIVKKLSKLSLKKPLHLDAHLQGHIKFRDTPLVRVNWIVQNNTFLTPYGEIQNASFDGSFTNQKTPGAGHGDENSLITLNDFHGNWYAISFNVDTLSLSNLKSPLLQGKVKANFPVSKLNRIIGGGSFSFKSGNAKLNLSYKGGVSRNDTNKAYVFGTVQVDDATVNYLPRQVILRKVAARVNFEGRDLSFSNVRLETQRSQFQMSGQLKNFLSLYYTDPSKMLLEWNIQSRHVELEDFIGLLSARKNNLEPESGYKNSTGTNAIGRASAQLDKVLQNAAVQMNISIAKLEYHRFEASDVHARMFFRENKIDLQDIHLRQSDGSLVLKGSVVQKQQGNSIRLNTDIQNVNVQKLFASFGNFGQDAITRQNVRGTLNASADFTGAVSTTGKVVPYSLSGKIKFQLNNGELLQFAPLQKLGKLVFRNRNVDSVQIRSLKGALTLQGKKVIIPPIWLETSVLNMKVEGVYGFDGGTDIDIDVPLRNPKKDWDILNDSVRKERSAKGIVLHFKAVDGDDGNVKIKWILHPGKDK